MDSKENMSPRHPTRRLSALRRRPIIPHNHNDQKISSQPGLFCEKTATLPSAVKRTCGEFSELAKRRRMNEEAATKNGAKAKTKPARPQVKRKGPDCMKSLPMSLCTETVEAQKESHIRNICSLLKEFNIGRQSIPYVFPEAIRPRPETENGYKQEVGRLLSAKNPPATGAVVFKGVEEYGVEFLSVLWLFLAVSMRQNKGVIDRSVPDIPHMLSNIVAERQMNAQYGSNWDRAAEVLVVDLQKAVLLQLQSLMEDASQSRQCFEAQERGGDLEFPLQPAFLPGYERTDVTLKRLVDDIRKSRDFVAIHEGILLEARENSRLCRRQLWELRLKYIDSRRCLLGFLEMLQRKLAKTDNQNRRLETGLEVKWTAVCTAAPTTQFDNIRNQDHKIVGNHAEGSSRISQRAAPQDTGSKVPQPPKTSLGFVEGLLREIENG